QPRSTAHPGQDVNDGGDAHEALVSYAARGPEEAARAGLALAFAISEGYRLDLERRLDAGQGSSGIPGTPRLCALRRRASGAQPGHRRGEQRGRAGGVAALFGHPDAAAPSRISWAGPLAASARRPTAVKCFELFE